jgi:hypothetical protein
MQQEKIHNKKFCNINQIIWFMPRTVHLGFVVAKMALGQAFLQVPRFPLSVSVHCCSIFSHVLSGAGQWADWQLQFHQDIVSSLCNNNQVSYIHYTT